MNIKQTAATSWRLTLTASLALALSACKSEGAADGAGGASAGAEAGEQVGGEVGYFQNELQVYGKEGQECCRRKCKGTVEKVVISGRSTFYCANCQK